MEEISTYTVIVDRKQHDGVISYLKRNHVFRIEGKSYDMVEERWLGTHPHKKNLPESGMMLIYRGIEHVMDYPTDENFKDAILDLIKL